MDHTGLEKDLKDLMHKALFIIEHSGKEEHAEKVQENFRYFLLGDQPKKIIDMCVFRVADQECSYFFSSEDNGSFFEYTLPDDSGEYGVMKFTFRPHSGDVIVFTFILSLIRLGFVGRIMKSLFPKRFPAYTALITDKYGTINTSFSLDTDFTNNILSPLTVYANSISK